MRLLQISKFFPPEHGGIEACARELAEGFSAAGIANDVLCCARGRATLRERAAAGYGVVRAGSLGLLHSTSMAPALIAETRRAAGDYDVLHVHMPDPMAALAVWRARPRGKLVLHWHSDVVRQRLALKLYGPLQRWLLARADAIVATSEPYAAASRALAPWRDKLAVIPVGIGDNAARLRTDRVAALKACHAGKKIVFALGRMASYKGFDVLIEAAARLSDDRVVLIGGAGPLLDRYRAQVDRLGLAERVRLLGPMTDDDLITHLHGADVFCLPSITRAEAFGVAMLEAMAAGRPVVASDIPGSGVPWVNQDGVTGFNVRLGDAPALAQAIERVLGDDALAARMGAASRQRYRSEFTAAAMTRRFIDLYGRLAA